MGNLRDKLIVEQQAENERLRSDRYEWEKLWKKASTSVISLQSRIELLSADYDALLKRCMTLQSRNEELEAVAKPFADAHHAMSNPNIIIDPYEHITLHDLRVVAEAGEVMKPVLKCVFLVELDIPKDEDKKDWLKQLITYDTNHFVNWRW